MTIEEFDSRSTSEKVLWVKDKSTGFSYRWTGWKRKHDPRLMTSSDQSIPLDPIDDSLAGQWCAGTLQMMYYSSVPGGQGVCHNTSGVIETLDCEVKPGQTALTIHSSPDLLEHCRRDGFARLIVTMEKMGAIEGPHFSMA